MYTLEWMIRWARTNEKAMAPGSDYVFLQGNDRLWGETADALEDSQRAEAKEWAKNTVPEVASTATNRATSSEAISPT